LRKSQTQRANRNFGPSRIANLGRSTVAKSHRIACLGVPIAVPQLALSELPLVVPGTIYIRKDLGHMTSRAKLKSGWHAGFLPLACWSLMLLPNPPAFGQAAEPASAPQPARNAFRRVSIDDQVKGLAQSLNLNGEQQASVKKILEQQQRDSLHILRNSSATERIGSLRALQLRTAAQIRATLNDEQKEKYDPLGPRPSQRTSPQPSVEDWIKATTPAH